MSVCFIPCTQDCAYQKDGFCILEFPAAISEPTANGCVYHKQASAALPYDIMFTPPQLQKQHECF